MAWDVLRGLLFQFMAMMDYFFHLLLLLPDVHFSHHTDLANRNVYVSIHICRFRYKHRQGHTRVYVRTLLSLDASSICKYLQTAMSGIYVLVTMAELAVQMFQSAPYQSCEEINKSEMRRILKRMHIVSRMTRHVQRGNINKAQVLFISHNCFQYE